MDMKQENFSWDKIDPILKGALQEDIGAGDITTDQLIPLDTVLEAEWVARESCCLCGLAIAERILEILDPKVKCFWMFQDGETIEPGKLGLVKGSARSILKAERTALNFLQRLSGISTLTRAFVRKTEKYGVKIYDTRKTTPGLRALEKYAVRMGGGFNHRMGLDDMALIKENHQHVLEDLAFDHQKSLVQKIKKDAPKIQIGIEVEHISQIKTAVEAGADFILLDNMTPRQVSEIAKIWKGKVILEVSGGIRLENVEAYAQAKPDRISIGALTHSVKAIDISLEVLSAE